MTEPVTPPSTRRDFLRVSGALAWSVLGGATLAIGAPSLLFPLNTKTTSGSDEFLDACAAKKIKGGAPQRVELRSDRRDGWNRFDNVLLGAVWLVEDQGEIRAFSAACPHLGCGVDYDAARKNFVCHCHKSYFGLNGEVLSGPSPRGLDALDWRRHDELLQVRFQRFRYGKETQEPIT